MTLNFIIFLKEKRHLLSFWNPFFWSNDISIYFNSALGSNSFSTFNFFFSLDVNVERWRKIMLNRTMCCTNLFCLGHYCLSLLLFGLDINRILRSNFSLNRSSNILRRILYCLSACLLKFLNFCLC